MTPPLISKKQWKLLYRIWDEKEAEAQNELARKRRLDAERQRRYRAKLKAAKHGA